MNPLIHAPIDKWSIKEKLSLASCVLTAGDQNWYSVSRSLKPFGELNRPQDWFSQKNCALQYGQLLENEEKPKRKRGEKTEDTPQNLIVRKLTIERINQLKEEIAYEEKQLENLQKNINLLKNDNLSETDQKIIEKQMIDALAQAEKDEQKHQLWLKEREEKYASISRKKSFAAIKTPRKDDTPTRTPSTPCTPTASSSQSTPLVISNSTVEERMQIDDAISQANTTDNEQQLNVKQEKLTVQETSEQTVVSVANRIITRDKVKDVEKSQVITIREEEKRQTSTSDKSIDITESTNKDDDASNDKPSPLSPSNKEKTVDSSSRDKDNSSPDKTEQEIEETSSDLNMDTDSEIMVSKTKDETKERSVDKNESIKDEQSIKEESIATNKRKRTSTSISITYTTTPTISSPAVSVQQPAQQQTPQSQQPARDQTTPTTQTTRRSGRIKPLRSSTISKTELSVAAAAAEQQTSSQQTPQTSKKNGTHSGDEAFTPSLPLQSLPLTPLNASQLIMNDESTKDSTTSDLTDNYTSPNSPESALLNIDQNDPEQVKEQKEYRIWKKSIMLLWREIATHKFSSLFAAPVTDDEAKDYSAVVFRPVDLRTLKTKLENNLIRSTAEFQRDVMLMFQNAIMYNSVKHEVHQMTLEMQKEVIESIEDFINNQKNVAPVSTPAKETPSSRRKSRTL